MSDRSLTLPSLTPTLRFRDDALEARFQDAYFEESLTQVRWALFIGIIFYGPFFGWLDIMQRPPNLYGILGIRLGVCVLTAGYLAFTYAEAFRRAMQASLSGLILLAGLGLVAMMALDTSGQGYDDGPALLILPAYVLIRLRFVYATPVGWLILLAYAIAAILETDHATGTVVSRVIFLGAANLIGMFAGYTLERYARTSFWQRWLIDQKRQENERLLHTRTRFFGNITHEFRTPLTLILGPLDRLLEDRTLGTKARSQLGMMRRNAKQLLTLITELLDLAKLDAGRMPLRVASVDVVAFTQHTVDAFEAAAASKQLTLLFEAPPTLIAPIDATNLERVLFNLLGNAMKYTPAEGTIRLKLEAQAEEKVWSLSVRDTGPGIAAEHLPYIFDRFEQGDATDTPLSTGIGLALVKELVERHHGQIAVFSEIGFGTEFVLTLPLHEAVFSDGERMVRPVLPEHAQAPRPDATAQPSVSSPEPEDQLPLSDRPVLLVVEDNPDVRLLVRDTLADTYTIWEAADGAAGWERIEGEVPDLVLTDLRMPVLDGWALCRRIKEHPATDHIPVIMLTAQASRAGRVEGLETGADAYLGKPFHADELRAQVANLLSQRQRLRERFRVSPAPLSTTAPLPGPAPTPVDVPSADTAFLQKAQAVVEAHIDDSLFTIDAFAEEMGLSRRQLQRKLKAVSDQTPSAFIRLLRLKRGAQLLEQGYGYVADVAYAVGFNNPTYFTTCFREAFGVPPSAFQQDAS